MNELKIFENAEFGKVRTMVINNEPWFVGKDVAIILGYAKPLNAISQHVDEDDSLKQGLTDSLGRTQDSIFINESGLYSLILSSKLDSAKKFKKWVTSEVLPSIRKHGMYATEDLLNNPDFAIATFQALKEEREARKNAERIIEEQKPLVTFAQNVSNSEDCIDFEEFAKILANKKIKIGRNRLFKLFREKEILMKDNLPYQKYIENGYFKVIEMTVSMGIGSKIITKTLFTSKGQLYFSNKIIEWIA